MVDAGADVDNKGYIEVRTEGGFNLDPSTTYENTNGVKYDENYNKVVTDSDIAHNLRDEVSTQDKVTYDKELVGSDIQVTENVVKEEVIDTETSQIRNDNVVQNGVEGYEIVTTVKETVEVSYETQKVDTYQGTKPQQQQKQQQLMMIGQKQTV